jgi:hypothetical protein
MSNPVKTARAQHKEWVDDSLKEAIKSRLVHLGFGLALIISANIFGRLVAMDRKFPPLIAMSFLGCGCLAGVTYVKGKDADQDWVEWQALNSGKSRADFMTSILKSQVDGLALLSSSFYSNLLQPIVSQVIPEARVIDEPVAIVEQNKPIDIARNLATNIKSSIIVGQPGSGKGLTVAHATRHLKIHYPDIQIWLVDPKQDENELTYWNACDRICNGKLPAFANSGEVELFQNEVDEFIEEFKQLKGRKLLIFDEALAVKELTKKWFIGLMAGFNHLCSTGRSKGVYGWILSQTPNAVDFGISGGARNVYRRVLLVKSDDIGLITNRSTFFNGLPGNELLKQNERVFFDSLGNSWGSTPQYGLFENERNRLDRDTTKSTHDELERLYQARSIKPKHEQYYESGGPKKELSTQELVIIEYCRKKGGSVTVAKLRSARLPALKDLGTAEIRSLCQGLVDGDHGFWDDEVSPGEFVVYDQPEDP